MVREARPNVVEGRALSDQTRPMLFFMPPHTPESTFPRTLEAARSGDQAAVEVLFEQFYSRVQRMVHLSLARDLRTSRPWLLARFSTGDVVQDVFRSLLGDLSGFRGDTEDAFVGYLAMVVRNRLIDAIRFHEAAQRDGRLSAGEVEMDLQGSREVEPGEHAASVEELDRFEAALATLDERERLLLRERLERNTSFEELAKTLGYGSRDAARRAFYASKARLAIQLGRGDEPGDAR